MDNYTKIMMREIARKNNITLSAEHLRVLEYADKFYQKHHVGPMYHTLHTQIGTSRADLMKLFPNGLHSVYAWIGIPVHTPEKSCKPIPKIPVKAEKELYFDHNATTYMRKEIVQVLKKHLDHSSLFTNPGSGTRYGKYVYSLIEQARFNIARCLSVDPETIIFTSGGSEANNTAIKGIAFNHLADKGHLVCSVAAHSSILEAHRFLEKLGFDVTYVKVGKDGRINPEDIQRHLKKETILVSIMAVNNELGVINPCREISEWCSNKGVPVFVDAVQAFGKMPINPEKDGYSMLSLSGHKIYGPKGVGALYVKKTLKIPSLIHGGGQEMGRRAGTENAVAIEAFGLAAKLIVKEMDAETKRLGILQKRLIEGLKAIEPDCLINGSMKYRLTNTVNVSFKNVSAGSLLLTLDQAGIYVSAGSACNAGKEDHSHVISAIGVDFERYGTIRISMGLRTEYEDIDYFIHLLPIVLKAIRNETINQ